MGKNFTALSKEAHQILVVLERKQNIEKSVAKRIQIIILSNEGKTLQEIAESTQTGERTVARWRKRWKQEAVKLESCLSDTAVSNKEAERELYLFFKDRPRSGTPTRLTEEETVRLIALACEDAEVYGYPVSNWTHELLAEQAGKMGILISPSYYGKLLKKRLTAP